jgi:hypothetical protein
MKDWKKKKVLRIRSINPRSWNGSTNKICGLAEGWLVVYETVRCGCSRFSKGHDTLEHPSRALMASYLSRPSKLLTRICSMSAGYT